MSRCRMIEYDGKKQSLAKWSRDTGLDVSCIQYRLDVMKWEPGKALTTPSDQVANRTIALAAGREVKGNLMMALKKALDEYGWENAANRIKQELDADFVKTINKFFAMLPKETDSGNNQAPKCAIQINNVMPSDEFGKRFIPLEGD